MSDKIYGVILAGGIGSRMGNIELPKQYIKIAGKPIIIHTIEKFSASAQIDELIVLCPEEWVEYTKQLTAEYQIRGKKISIIPGGASRNDTIMAAIKYIEETDRLTDDTLIVTHDSVRPFVTERIISENIEKAIRFGACTTSIAAIDTICQSESGEQVGVVPDRSKLYQVQTPQTFHAKRLRELYQALTDEEKEILTDATKICILQKDQVGMVMGEHFNIKITYPYDLIVAEAIIKSGV